MWLHGCTAAGPAPDFLVTHSPGPGKFHSQQAAAEACSMNPLRPLRAETQRPSTGCRIGGPMPLSLPCERAQSGLAGATMSPGWTPTRRGLHLFSHRRQSQAGPTRLAQRQPGEAVTIRVACSMAFGWKEALILQSSAGNAAPLRPAKTSHSSCRAPLMVGTQAPSPPPADVRLREIRRVK